MRPEVHLPSSKLCPLPVVTGRDVALSPARPGIPVTLGAVQDSPEAVKAVSGAAPPRKRTAVGGTGSADTAIVRTVVAPGLDPRGAGDGPAQIMGLTR